MSDFHTNRPLPNKNIIQGLDLTIDPNIQKICETYNQSSGATRSVLYVSLIVCIIALIAVFNSSWAFNWTDDRLAAETTKILSLEKHIDSAENKCYTGSKLLKSLDSLSYDKKRRELFLNTDVENNLLIKASIIGVSIDVNDLSAIFGISIIILLFILRFTLYREKNNLKIALISINERYSSHANFLFLKTQYKIEYQTAVLSTEQWLGVISDINFLRRKFHYNFLSMNEVFNLPYLEENPNALQEKPVGKFINKYLYYFIIVVYSYILFNDLSSITVGIRLNQHHTFFLFFFSVGFYIIAFIFCEKCINLKQTTYALFKSFYKNEYSFKDIDYSPKERSLINSLGISVGLIIFLIILSFVVQKIFPNDTLNSLIVRFFDFGLKLFSSARNVKAH